MACAPSEDSDQPGNPLSLIRVFAVRMKKTRVLSYPFCAQRRLWSDWVHAQADLSRRWAHMPFCWFCHEAAHVGNLWHKQSICFQVCASLLVWYSTYRASMMNFRSNKVVTVTSSITNMVGRFISLVYHLWWKRLRQLFLSSCISKGISISWTWCWKFYQAWRIN